MKCFVCFGSHGKIRLDRKGRPYFTCDCGHRLFLKSREAYLAILAWSEVANSMGREKWDQMLANMTAHAAVSHPAVQNWMATQATREDVAVEVDAEVGG